MKAQSHSRASVRLVSIVRHVPRGLLHRMGRVGSKEFDGPKHALLKVQFYTGIIAKLVGSTYTWIR